MTAMRADTGWGQEGILLQHASPAGVALPAAEPNGKLTTWT